MKNQDRWVTLTGQDAIDHVLKQNPDYLPEPEPPNKEELHAYLKTIYPKVVEAWNG